MMNSRASMLAQGVANERRNGVDVLPDSGFAFRLNESGYRGNNSLRDNVASFVSQYMDKHKDPAADIKGMPPLFGQDVLPHAMTFQSLIGSYAKTYLPADEALEANPNDAAQMLKNVGIRECLQIRQFMVALTGWSIQPENSKSPAQKSLAAMLTKCLQRIRRFTEYRRCMQTAIWSGKAAIQHRYGYDLIDGQEIKVPKSLHQDDLGWKHIHGDKIVFRYDDGREFEPGAFPDQMGIRVSAAMRGNARRRGLSKLEATNSGTAYFLSPAERSTVLCHKHMIEDAEFTNPRKAGRIHGIGIRDMIYNEWFLYQEILGFVLEYAERSAGGIEIWEYPSGDAEAKASIMEAAKNRMSNGRNQLFFPKPLGMDAGVYDLRIVEPGFSGIETMLGMADKYFGHRIKRLILGQTLTTEADATGLGSGVADAHRDTLSQIIRYDISNHDETVTEELVRVIQLENWPETECWKMRFVSEIESDDVQKRMEGYQAAFEMGLGIPEKDVAQCIGISLDNPNEKLLKKAQEGMGMGMAGMGGNGMQFPSHFQFQSAVDAAKQGVEHAGNLKADSEAAKSQVLEKLTAGKGEEPSSGGDSVTPAPGAPVEQYARQMEMKWTEEDEKLHPRDEIGRFTERDGGNTSTSPADNDLPDGKVQMRQAKAGGETSDVDGKFYKGGQLMPVHGLYSGREKPAPKPKKENPFGGLPVASEDSKGLPSARKKTDEQIAREREEMEEKAAWMSVQSGPLRDMLWVGDKPGKTAYDVKKQLIPFFSSLTDDQISQIGEFAFKAVVDYEAEKYPDVSREEIESEFNQNASYTADLLLNKKTRKQFPSMERAIEAIRAYSNFSDPVQRWTAMDQHLRSVLGSGQSASHSPDETPERKNVGPAGLSKSEAIQKAKKGGTGQLTHAEAVSATMLYLGTGSGDWSAVPVEGMVEVQDASGKARTVPQFSMPKDYTPVETPWTSSGSGGEFCCELCATPIKNAFHIQNDQMKWLMTVGSECVTKFGEGMSGEQLAKRDMQRKRRNLVKVAHEAIKGFAEKIKAEKNGRNVTLQDVAKAIGNDDSRKRFWRVAKSLGIDPYSTQWRIDKDGVVHEDDFKHLDGFSTREKSTDQKIGNWHKKNADDAEMMLKDLKRFGVDVPDKYSRQWTAEDEKLHPRNPAGSSGGTGGQFTSRKAQIDAAFDEANSTSRLPGYVSMQALRGSSAMKGLSRDNQDKLIREFRGKGYSLSQAEGRGASDEEASHWLQEPLSADAPPFSRPSAFSGMMRTDNWEPEMSASVDEDDDRLTDEELQDEDSEELETDEPEADEPDEDELAEQARQQYVASLPTHVNAVPRIQSTHKTPVGEYRVYLKSWQEDGEAQHESIIMKDGQTDSEFWGATPEEALADANEAMAEILKDAEKVGQVEKSGQDRSFKWSIHHDGKGGFGYQIINAKGEAEYSDDGFNSIEDAQYDVDRNLEDAQEAVQLESSSFPAVKAGKVRLDSKWVDADLVEQYVPENIDDASAEEIADKILADHGTEVVNESDMEKLRGKYETLTEKMLDKNRGNEDSTIDGEGWEDWYLQAASNHAEREVRAALIEHVEGLLDEIANRVEDEDEDSPEEKMRQIDEFLESVKDRPVKRRQFAEQIARVMDMDFEEAERIVQAKFGTENYQRRANRLLEEAASQTDVNPTPAQIEAGNYAKGVYSWKGLEIAIENPKGSTRSGVSASGRKWERVMACHYGYFRRTKANDGDALDVYVGNHPDSEFVLVIKQIDQGTREFDEFKVVVGCLNRKEAKRLYLANYPSGWKCGPMADMTVGLFKKWVEKGGPMREKSVKVD